MQIITRSAIIDPIFSDLQEQLRELNYVRFASEAACDMEFGNRQELDQAIRRAIEICMTAGLKLEDHFKRIYICTDSGIVTDWKLSIYGYQLVCLNGSPSNENVARMQTSLVKSMS